MEKATTAVSIPLRSPEVAENWGIYHQSEKSSNPGNKIAEQIEQLGAKITDDPAQMSFILQFIAIEKKALKRLPKNTSPELAESIAGLEKLEAFFKEHAGDIAPNALQEALEEEEKKNNGGFFRKGLKDDLRGPKRRLKRLKRKKDKGKKINLKEFEKLSQKVPHLQKRVDDQKARVKDLKRMVKLLQTLEHRTGQNELGPVAIYKTLWHMLEHVAEHINEQRKERPGKFTSATLGCLALFLFMRWKIPGSDTMYVDTSVDQVNDLSLNDLLDPNYVPTFSDTANTVASDASIHDHLSQFVGDTIAEGVRQIPLVNDLIPKDRSRLKDLAETVQGGTEFVFDFLNFRVPWMTKGPLDSLGDIFIRNPQLQEAFSNATYQAQENVCFANGLENVVLHGLLACATHAIMYEAKSMSNDSKAGTNEARHHWEEVQDFRHRFWENSRLSINLAVMGAAYAFGTNGGFDPSMVWMSALGLWGGEVIHKNLRKRNSAKYVASITKEANQHLQDFAKVEVNQTKKPKSLSRFIPGFLKNKFAIATLATGAAATAVDVRLTGGTWTVTALGHMGVYSLFMGWNAIEDAALHIIFALVGAGTGYTHAEAERIVKNRFFKENKLTGPEPAK